MDESSATYIVILNETKVPDDKHKPNCFIIVFSLMAVTLICLSIYMHIKQQPHLGRLKFEYPKDKNEERKYEQFNVEAVAAPTASIELTAIHEMNSINHTLNITSGCLHCICSTLNHCTQPECSPASSNCSSYHISKFYWVDSGALTPPLYEAHQNHMNYTQGYLDCIADNGCTEKTINNYMTRFSRDCNNDGRIDCQDYILIHILGPSGCQRKQLSQLQKQAAKQCLDIL